MNILPNIELYFWLNLKQYLTLYPTCLLDNLLCVADANETDPRLRYKDFLTEFPKRITLGEYSAQKIANNLPHLSIRFEHISDDNCTKRLFLVFNVSYQIASCDNLTGGTAIANSPEAILAFKANVLNGVNQLLRDANFERTEDDPISPISFWEFLRGKQLPDPRHPDNEVVWNYPISAVVVGDSRLREGLIEDEISTLSTYYVIDVFGLGDSTFCGG